MGWWLKHHTDHDLKFIFMNTGCEHEKTLEFLNECDTRWGLNLIWVEAVVNHAGRGYGFGTRHRTVNFETAARVGEPFEDSIKKYGIPNAGAPNCSMHLKEEPLKSYMRENHMGDWVNAVGIRSDEVDRINPNHKQHGLVYPLIDMHPTTENDIMHWWSRQDFDLQLKQFQGNCSWCWKKSFRKLTAIAQTEPELFEFPARMEAKYPHKGQTKEMAARTFFRANKTTQEVLAMAKDNIPFNPSPVTQPDMFWDETGGCSESCEVFSE